jgi:hypothetical protein
METLFSEMLKLSMQLLGVELHPFLSPDKLPPCSSKAARSRGPLEGPAAVVTVATQGATLKLRAADYKSLVLIGDDDFSCDSWDRQVPLNHKPRGHLIGSCLTCRATNIARITGSSFRLQDGLHSNGRIHHCHHEVACNVEPNSQESSFL